MIKERVHLIMNGRVQGVGYRMFVFRIAQQYGISGWVRNRVDGSVEAEIEGEPEVVKTIIELLYARNSPIIRVDTIAIQSIPSAGKTGFEII